MCFQFFKVAKNMNSHPCIPITFNLTQEFKVLKDTSLLGV